MWWKSKSGMRCVNSVHRALSEEHMTLSGHNRSAMHYSNRKILQIRQKKCKRCADASTLLRTSCYVWWCSPEAVLSDGVHHGVCARIGSQHYESLIHDRSPSYEQMSQHFFNFFAAVLLLRSEYKTFKSICDVCTVVAQKRNQNDCFCGFWEVFEKQLWWLLSHTGHYTIKSVDFVN